MIAGRQRLLLAVDKYPDGGGIAAIVENCVSALEPEYDVHVAIVDERSGRSERLSLPEPRVHVLTSKHVLKPFLMPTSLLYPVRVGRFLRTLVSRLNPDALLVQDGLFLPIPGLLATRGTRTRLVVMDHGTLTNSLDPHWQRLISHQLDFPNSLVFRVGFALDRPWRSLRWRIGLKHADATWYVGYELEPWLARAGARSARYSQIVPSDFAPPSQANRDSARSYFDVPPGAPLINMVTRLAGEKGLPPVLDAITSLRARFPSLVLLIAGEGPLEEWLRTEIRVRRLCSSVRLLGQLTRPEIQRLHHASDFHLYAGSIGCGMSIALLESMAAGVLPIVSDVPREHRELVAGAGWVFPANNERALHKSLESALKTTDLERTRLRSMALERIRGYLHPSLSQLVSDLLNASA